MERGFLYQRCLLEGAEQDGPSNKGGGKGLFLRVELALPPFICAGIWSGSTNPDPMPVEISDMISADC